jgi:hypothetical protein
MPNLRQYYLVSESELQKVKENDRPCLDYSEIYDTFVKNKEEAQKEKLPITAWELFDWKNVQRG